VRLEHSASATLPFRDNRRIKLGEAVVVVGYPLQGIVASSMNLTTGTVSALAGLGDDTRMVQFTAPIQPGNSGGPLLDHSGSVVGIVASKLSPLWTAQAVGDIPQNVNFAIKGSVVRDFLDSKGVAYQTVGFQPALDTTELADRAAKAVVALQCTSGSPAEPSVSDRRPTRSATEVLRTAKTVCILVRQGSPVLKTEIGKELLKWGRLALLSSPNEADLVLEVIQTGRLSSTGEGNQAAALLREPASGLELWSSTKGGSWAMSGFGNARVGRAIARDLTKFLDSANKKSTK